MLIAGKHEVPDECPSDCRFSGENGYQGSMCCRCPIFNCREIPGPEGEPFRLLLPEDYRSDWAEQWERFFNTGEPLKLSLFFGGN